MDKQRILAFWNTYQSTLPDNQIVGSKDLPEAWGFGNSPEMANQLSQLVVEGIKTATCSLYWSYEFENEPIPKVGDLSIIIDGDEIPVGIIQTTEVQIKPYDQVDARFAYDEGEGDRSLTYWKEVHWHFFSIECGQIDREPKVDMPLVCERFQLIYTSPSE